MADNTLTFGTYRLDDHTAFNMIIEAVKLGVKSIDTAQLYRNEKSVGDALLYLKPDEEHMPKITTKIHRNDIKAAAHDVCAIEKSFEKSIKNLPFIDSVLLHSPEDGFVEAWKQLCALQCKYKTFKIGVSNFGIVNLEALKIAGLQAPAYNQIEITPFNQCRDLSLYCTDNNIVITSHSCLTKGEKLENETLKRIANKYSCTSAQILIKWCLSKGYTPIARTSSLEHLQENINAHKILLNEDDLQQLSSLEEGFQTHPQYTFVKNVFVKNKI